MALGHGRLPSIADVLERLGPGWAQIRLYALATGFWIADGAELLLVGAVNKALTTEWALTAWQRSALASIVFVGMLTGNLFGGPLGDYAGRRFPIFCAYLGILVFSLLSAASTNFPFLCSVRFFVGISVGIGTPASISLFSEMCPVHWRLLSNGTAQGLFVLGEIYAISLIWLQDPLMENIDWRQLLVLGSIPSIILGAAAWVFLHESPYYLAARGDREGALKVLEAIRDENGAHDVSVEFESPPHHSHEASLWDCMLPFRLIFAPRLIYSTLVLGFVCFFMNMSYYGGLYVFPQLVTKVDVAQSPAGALMMGALAELPGIPLGLISGLYLGRKPAITLSLVLTTISLVSFVTGVYADHQLLLNAGYSCIKVFVMTNYMLVYQYTSEVYATEARATGAAAIVSAGRIGGMLAPVIAEFLRLHTGSYMLFFSLLAALACAAIPLVALLPFETYGKALDDVDAESLPLIPEVVR